jgi:DNA-binding GntR family transcriptional regulator
VAEAKGVLGVLRPSGSAASLAERAYHEIRDMIVSLELRPGAVIDERSLMERLGIGRTPTREGLRRLAQEGLVEVYPRRGMFVTSVEIRDLASSAHNPFLESTLEEYYVLALRIWYLALDQARELEQAVLAHRELLEAIRDGDADRAEETMRRHVLEFEESMRRVLTGA